MAGAGRKWLIGCGAGCGGLILLIILISVGGSLWMMKPMNAAVDSQKATRRRHPSPNWRLRAKTRRAT